MAKVLCACLGGGLYEPRQDLPWERDYRTLILRIVQSWGILCQHLKLYRLPLIRAIVWEPILNIVPSLDQLWLGPRIGLHLYPLHLKNWSKLEGNSMGIWVKTCGLRTPRMLCTAFCFEDKMGFQWVLCFSCLRARLKCGGV